MTNWRIISETSAEKQGRQSHLRFSRVDADSTFDQFANLGRVAVNGRADELWRTGARCEE